MRIISTTVITTFILCACSTTKQIDRAARKTVLQDSSLKTAHVGISIFEPAAGKYWYNFQGDKYFVPASNTKIPTCYAAMKYLGDSLVGIEYVEQGQNLVFKGSGDPTLLHPDFKQHRVLDFLKHESRDLVITMADFTANRWGSGWSVSDVDASYAPERNEMPVYGNILRIFRVGDSLSVVPNFLKENVLGIIPEDWRFQFQRNLDENSFSIVPSNQKFTSQHIPFGTGRNMLAFALLGDTLKKNLGIAMEASGYRNWKKFHSQPTDSLLKPMMHRSDNFFAEQSLLMVSNEMLGVMNDSRIIDTIMKTDFKELPQRPRWADGSGLSRYNLFTPQDFVSILYKMKNEFGMERLKEIFPTGNEGTLNNYYKSSTGFIFAKTGTLSGVVALSGYLYTKENRLLIFSVLVNNHQASATAVRRAVEKFIEGIRERY